MTFLKSKNQINIYINQEQNLKLNEKFQAKTSNSLGLLGALVFLFSFLMALCEALRGPQGQDKPGTDLNKYLIALHFVHSWGGIKCHNANKLNNRNGILNIQSKVSL